MPGDIVCIDGSEFRRICAELRAAGTAEALAAATSLEAAPLAAPEQATEPSVLSEAGLQSLNDKYSKIDSLSQVLEGGDVALVKGSWLMQYLREGNLALPKRQELPQQAVWDPQELLAVVNTSRHIYDCAVVPIVAVSYGWEAADHADPCGDLLRDLCRVLEQCLKVCADVALFVDWSSFWQNPRTAEQQVSFHRALDSVDLWFAHQLSWTWLLSRTPRGSDRPVVDRGWPNFERAVAQLSSHFDMVLDFSQPLESLGDIAGYEDLEQRCRAARCAPLVPTAFQHQLQRKSFSDASDLPFLARRYARTFAEVMGSVVELSYAGLCFGPGEARLLADALKWCGNLEVLSVDDNNLSSEGAEAIALVLPRLQRLRGIYANRCGARRHGVASLLNGARGLSQLGALYLSGNGVGDEEEVEELRRSFQQWHPRAVVGIS